MRRLLLLAVLATLSAAAQDASPPLTADAIMARVAANQDRTEASRTHYIYMQHVRVVSRKPSGRVMCEEITDSRVSPTPGGIRQQLLTLDGRHWKKSGYLHYTRLQGPDSDAGHGGSGDAKAGDAKSENNDLEGMDVDLVENLRKNLTNEETHEPKTADSGLRINVAEKDDASKDGLAQGLFPLTSKQQSKYLFQLAGRQTMNGRDTYHIRFRPKDKDDFDWKGEAYIDAAAFEPVVVYTEMSRRIPIAVRMLLGTNLPGLGFSVTYDRQPDGVWFPVSFGTEFRMRVLFFIARDISMSLANTHFEKTHADVRILEGIKLADGLASPRSP